MARLYWGVVMTRVLICPDSQMTTKVQIPDFFLFVDWALLSLLTVVAATDWAISGSFTITATAKAYG